MLETRPQTCCHKVKAENTDERWGGRAGEERKPLEAGLVFRLGVRRSRGSHRTSEPEPRLGYTRPYLREQSKNISQPSKLNPKPKLPGKESMNKDKQYFSPWLGTRRQNQEPKATHPPSATQ